ncbi:unnamed protein product [Rotaria sordida]|uniref:Uncharacterized protein n=1 Tax=Rotaria sordida TaxID=392033 RepID=A0A815L101_9BILA|nr:unnamed protein product [Rotaria sordida]
MTTAVPCVMVTFNNDIIHLLYMQFQPDGHGGIEIINDDEHSINNIQDINGNQNMATLFCKRKSSISA